METQDLWPDFFVEKVRGPKSILQEQATFLKKKTKGILKADVLTKTSQDQIYHFFRLISPALNYYKYDLFSISHGIELYPVMFDVGDNLALLSELDTVLSPSDYTSFIAYDEPSFITALSTVLKAPSTLRIIQNLYSQSLDELPV